MKKINYRHFICIGIILVCLACTVLLFPNAIGRFIASVRDLCVSLGFTFCEIFGISHSITPAVNDLPQWTVPPFLPDTFDGFKLKFFAYWKHYASLAGLKGYLYFLGGAAIVLLQISIVIIPLYVIGGKVIKRYLNRENNDYNIDSRPLKLHKKISRKIYMPVYRFFTSLITFIKAHKPYYISWLIIWLFNLNAFTIVLGVLAYYVYFIGSFDILNLYRQVYKFAIDLSVPITTIPIWAWGILALILLNRFRKRVGYARLNHMERCNRGFINERPILTMVCGTMGKKKTTLITDMVLSNEIMLRDKAFEKLLETDLKFPDFPWINLENSIKHAMATHSIYNLATCKRFIRSKQIKAFKRPLKRFCFGYDINTYALTYCDSLHVVILWEALEIYSQLYFIYIMQSSLLIANYSIRTDNLLIDLGNFPLWNSDFFSRDARLIDSYSRHAHILDFDCLRLGKKVLEDNPNKNAFEFGVIAITEVGKERGNNLELKEVKKRTDETNQKNDLFNTALKMIRHPATVDFFPFVKAITDEQRPSSWGADARDLCEIVHIRKSGDIALAMPFFALEEIAYDFVFSRFVGLYHNYRFIRGDNTLTMHLLKKLSAKLHHYYKQIYNTFGYCTMNVQVESGTLDGQYDDKKYYLMNKKIYSKRFATDCYNDFFTANKIKSPVGLNDLPEYASVKATTAELKQQHSYFIGDLGNMENTKIQE